jgi:hypothetical protein
MRHSTVRHNDKIELCNRRRGIGEIVDKRRQIDDRPTARERIEFLFRRPFLKAVELNAGKRKPLEDSKQRSGALLVTFEK